MLDYIKTNSSVKWIAIVAIAAAIAFFIYKKGKATKSEDN